VPRVFFDARAGFKTYFFPRNLDAILKERLFGLTGFEGNHGEDVKELYYYLESTPTHSYMKGLYKYPIDEYPYGDLVNKNQSRSRHEPEYEILDSGLFDKNRYFDVSAEYAKESDNDMLIKISVKNCSQSEAEFHFLPTLWFRNTWSWGCLHEGCTMKPLIRQRNPGDKFLITRHENLDEMLFSVEQEPTEWLWADNETNLETCYGVPNEDYKHKKDAFHLYLVRFPVLSTGPSILSDRMLMSAMVQNTLYWGRLFVFFVPIP
jgi:hypothetical protein